MLLTVQFPLADMRKILDIPARIKRPVWPLADPQADFVRFFGAIRERKAGGLIGWGSENENLICEAVRALSFRSDLSFVDSASKYAIVLCRAFTRFYFDGYAVGKVEIGVATKTRSHVTLTSQQTKDLLGHVLHLPVRVRTPIEQAKPDEQTEPIKLARNCELVEAGRLLARLYLVASTRNQMRTPDTLANWQVKVGAPLAFLEYGPEDTLEIPSDARALALPGIAGVHLHHYKFPYKKTGLVIHTWLLGRDSTADFQQARALRLHLLRLHSEHECLKAMLRSIELGHIAPTRSTAASDNLQFYLDRSLKRIKTLEIKSEQKFTAEIAEIARNAAEQADTGSVDTLLASVEKLDMRRTLTRRLAEHIAELGPLGDVVFGDKIEVSNVRDNATVTIKSTLGDVTQNIGNIPNAKQVVTDELNHPDVGKTELKEANMTADQGVPKEANMTSGSGDTITVTNVSGQAFVVIKSTMGNVVQNVGKIPNADQTTKDDLKHLVEQLDQLLQKTPESNVSDAATVAKRADQLVEEATAANPDKSFLQVTAEGLKKAAENIKAVLPDVIPIATSIIASVLKITGAG